MAVSIVQYPDQISLSGNLKALIVSSPDPVSISLSHNGKSIMDSEQYYPDKSNRINIELKNLIGDMIQYTTPDLTLVSTKTPDQFVITINGTDIITFSVIKGGVDVNILDAPVFLKSNWLTWQPQSVRTTYTQPQWLRYYADTAVNIRVKGYFEGEVREIIFSQIFAGLTTINAAYPVISEKFGQRPQYYDIWVETLGGGRLSYIQRYIYTADSFNEDIFVFQNTLGGFDSVRMNGEKTATAEVNSTIFRSDETDSELRIDYKAVFKKNTGYFDSEDKRAWIQELFKSSLRCVVSDGLLRRIVISDPKLESKSLQANSYTFHFALAKQSGFLNLPRAEELPEVLEITDSENVFFLAPRLLEFGKADIEKETLIPVQHPFEEQWRYITLLSVITALTKLTADQITEFLTSGNYVTESWLRENFPVHVHNNKEALDKINFDFKNNRWDTIYDIVIKNILLKAGIEDESNKLYILTKDGANAAIVEFFKLVVTEMSSPEFISGFLGGKGWALFNRTFINSVGEEESKAHLELDELTVRGTMRIYELIISQLLGENGTRLTTDMMKVLSIDADQNRIYMDTEEGVLYNPFRAGDVIMVQRFMGVTDPGQIVKQYEFIVESVGTSYDGDVRQEWVVYKNFVGDLNDVQARDVLTRVDSISNPDRKGIIKHTSVEPNSPYIDIMYGMKTDPGNAVKTRLGKLAGIISQWWGQLGGYGLFSDNAYLTGDFRLRTGEDVLTRFEIMEGRLQSNIQKTVNSLTEANNLFHNAAFADNLDGWGSANEIDVYGTDVDFLGLGVDLLSDKKKLAEVIQYDGRPVLHLMDSYVRQYAGLIKRPEKYTDTLYVTVDYKCNQPGKLTIGFEADSVIGGLKAVEIAVTPTDGFVRHTMSGIWNEQGSFVIRCTGDVYIENLSLTTRPLDEYKKEVSTLFQQTAESILSVARSVETVGGDVNRLNGLVDDMGDWVLGIDQVIKEGGWITTAQGNQLWASLDYVTNLNQALISFYGELSVLADQIAATVTKVDEVNGTIESAGWITKPTGNELWAKKEMENGEEIISTINQTPEAVKVKAKNIELTGFVSINNGFRVNEDGGLEVNTGTFWGGIKTPFKRINESDAGVIPVQGVDKFVKRYAIGDDLNLIDGGMDLIYLPSLMKYEGAHLHILNTSDVKTGANTFVATSNGSGIRGIEVTGSTQTWTDPTNISFTNGIIEFLAVATYDDDGNKNGIEWFIVSKNVGTINLNPGI